MDIGFNKDNVVMINARETDGNKLFSLFSTALKNNPEILGITNSFGSFGDNFNASGFTYNGHIHPAYNFSVSTNFASVMGMHLISGRMLDPKIPRDTINSVIVNEALVRDLSLTDESILGLKLQNYSRNPAEAPIVIGVVRDYNMLPARQKITPTLFRETNKYKPTVFYVHFKPQNPDRILGTLRAAWLRAAGDAIFDYTFLDDALNARYQQESRLSTVITYAAIVCIFLASLGLGSLAYLSSENRTKELVIRKVLGCSRSDIIYLLSKDYLQMVLLSSMIAVPLSWYFLHGWLEDFAFRIHISLWVYIITCMGALIFTTITLSTTLIKIAFISPANTLKTE
jgi:putative ABC transport system permease protein